MHALRLVSGGWRGKMFRDLSQPRACGAGPGIIAGLLLLLLGLLRGLRILLLLLHAQAQGCGARLQRPVCITPLPAIARDVAEAERLSSSTRSSH